MKNKVYIGCSGFTERLWKGFFYPEELAAKEYLSFYSKYLNAVEINSTFYRKPTLKTLEKWFDETEDNFKFFIKIPKAITHIKKLAETEIDTSEFCTHISSVLKEKLAGFLFQLPPLFQFSEENLQKVLNTVDENYLNVVEFRHQSWWTSEVFETLKTKNIIFSGVSIPRDIPDVFIVNNEKFSYYRLHGKPAMFKSEYSETELKKLATDIQKFEGTTFVFFNNTYGIAGIKNALYLKEIVERDSIK
ncbi:DUF72 domain-containing protein [Kaistella flava (ex Peng et al. 2021)]|uniref:DUF72 domain-containing protein n=1 Tax=Kaistella flava (ex Peng et al. 2021) TaxID=2038776 RepID=A0A7M2Y5I8_9FLAO|nr:DUF72 domain-containing protein [Kaistella flava (ex Peng et al. 2021)]QOW09441.1 DUF72 domain-containing protein [Kaistella flava (ex Peng et al. 2021)]